MAEVRVSRDLKSATVFTTELGGELDPGDGGGPAAGRRAIWAAGSPARCTSNTRRACVSSPDETFAYAARIGQLLHDAQLPARPREDDADGAP